MKGTWLSTVRESVLRRMSGGPGFRFRGAGLAAALVLAGSSLVLAQESEAPVSLPRLEFEHRCFFDTSGWNNRPRVETEFRGRLKSQLNLHKARDSKDLPGIEVLLAKATWKMAADLEKAGKLQAARDLAIEIFDLKAAPPELRSSARELNDRVSLVDMREALKGGLPDDAFRLAKGLLQSLNGGIVTEAANTLVTVEVKRSGIESLKGQDLAAEGQAIEGLVKTVEDAARSGFPGDLPPGVLSSITAALKPHRDRAEQIRVSTQKIGFARKDASKAFGPKFVGNVTSVDLAKVRITLIPVQGQKGDPWESRTGMPAEQLFMRGVYDLSVFAPGSDRPYAVWARLSLDEKRVDLQIPDRAAEGMVYVGPWAPGRGGFYIDIHEVTAAQVKTAAAANPGLSAIASEQEDGAGVPASFREDAEANGQCLVYANAVGRVVPTLQQWLDAAFGPYPDSERPYPWGPAAPVPGTHALLGQTAHGAVGQFPAGASPYGVLDMCGNMAEFVQHSNGIWAIGGHWFHKPEDFKTQGRNRLRDPYPSQPVYNAMSTDVKNTYSTYQAPYEDYYATGMRLVVPLP